jgi:CRISPR-associated protein Cmr6
VTRRPLYQRLADAKLPRDRTGHAGLWYDKLCNTWTVDGQRWELPSGDKSSAKQAWIATVAGDHSIGDAKLLDEAAMRTAHLTTAAGGQLCVMTTESRFVTGLGRSHPVENGFAWHPTLGVPYLPGSSIKGLVRAWAATVGDPGISDLFGPTGLPHKIGDLIFLDALPLAQVRLEIDIITPHYANWDADDPPGDWRSPVPVPFLAVPANAAFLFAVLSRQRATRHVERALTWLHDAARDAGAGAKTAVGYGRFVTDDPATTKLRRALEREQAELAKQRRRNELEATPEGVWCLRLEQLREADVVDQVRKRLETPITDPDDHRAFARAVTNLPYFADWQRGKVRDRGIKTSPDTIKARARTIHAVAQSDPPVPTTK